MFRFLLRFWFSLLYFGAGITNYNVSLKLLSCNASLEILIHLLNTSMFDEFSEYVFQWILGVALIYLVGGWNVY